MTLNKAIFLILGLLLAQGAYAAKFSNVIVFGDSYSDIGNFPESPYTLSNPHKKMILSNLNGMIYVPVSNPVNLKSYPALSLKGDHLPKQPLLNGNKRHQRSVSWTEFLTAYLYKQHKINSAKIMPSISLATNKHLTASTDMSVNYAFASATSRLGCTYFSSFDSVKPANCNRSAIITAREQYLNHPSNRNLHRLIIPGMRAQIQFFLNDTKNHKVIVNHKTVYILEIGGNDLLAATAHYHLPSADKMAYNVYLGAFKLITKANAKHVYINTLFNPYLTPYAGRHKLLGLLGRHIAKSYNEELRLTIKTLNKQFPGRVSLIDEYKDLQNIAHSKNIVIQKACQLHAHDNKCSGYMFWNAVHPSSNAQQQLGKDVFRKIAAS